MVKNKFHLEVKNFKVTLETFTFCTLTTMTLQLVLSSFFFISHQRSVNIIFFSFHQELQQAYRPASM